MGYTREDLDQVNWRNAAFPIGVKVPGDVRPWLKLEVTDLKILHFLLNLNANGIAAVESEELKQLSDWCTTAINWCEKEGIK